MSGRGHRGRGRGQQGRFRGGGRGGQGARGGGRQGNGRGRFPGGLGQGGRGSRGPRRVSDWQCPNQSCRNSNGLLCFGSKPVCSLCGTANPAAPGASGGSSHHHAEHPGGGRATAPGDRERRFFDKMTKDQNGTIDDSEDALRLLKAAISFAETEGDPALLYRLAEGQDASALKKALEYIDGESYEGQQICLAGLLPLLQRLGSDELRKPVYREPLSTVLMTLWELRFVVKTIYDMLAARHISKFDDHATLIWFFTALALDHSEVRNDPLAKQISDELARDGKAANLRTVMTGNTAAPQHAMSLAGVMDEQAAVPGGRHDNDSVNFRDIRILPTRDEFACHDDPYLPKFEADHTLTDAQLLDRQFRLLREDMIGPAKADQNDPRKQQRDLFFNVRASRIMDGAPIFKDVGDGRRVKVSGASDPCICFNFTLPKWHRVNKMKPAEKEQYWDRSRRSLPKDGLVCLLREDTSGTWSPVRFGQIKRREVAELAGKFPEIGVTFFSTKDMMETIQEFAERQQTPPTRLLVVSASLFAYDPVLKGLQSMASVPFADEILRGEKHETGTSNLATDYRPVVPHRLREQVGDLDPSQRHALEISLSNRVALIQGPPGTGKTYLGVLLTQVIHESTLETILCVCYTNHALDAFLGDLLDVGITGIVRLGGRSKSERLAQYNLRELASERSEFNRTQKKRYGELMTTIEDEQGRVRRLEKKCKMEIGANWWETVGEHLEDTDRVAWKQLRLTAHDLVDADGFQIQGITAEDSLWKLWLKGKRPPAAFQARAKEALWCMSKEERNVQKLKWQREVFADLREELANSIMSIQKAKLEIRQLQDMKDAAILSKARVIGCTTTKAAMCKHLLDDTAAGVVMVEEAAEIMEAHVLTSLSGKCKHLIMIGDHKQLRPKAEHYPLTVESNRGFDLNRSLFERLALTLPLATLGVQHRMHPDISIIPKTITYPELNDAPKVLAHPAVKGLQCRTVFVEHEVPEDARDQTATHTEAVSKTNAHEVAMVVATVRYMLQQGYQPGDLVVLTPYLGQLLKLQEALLKDVAVIVDDLDFNEAKNKLDGLEGFAVPGGAPKGDAADSVRVATVDNYQGEEANIVIVSLVRSNPDRVIGFLKEPERVNVMLSRAKHGQILIGNKSTMESARGKLAPLSGGPLWTEICKNMRVERGIPVKCQTHGRTAVISAPGDFQRNCPDGGCTAACGKQLVCGHFCTKQCHVGSCVVQCKEIVIVECSEGHDVQKQCGGRTPKCKHQVKATCDGRSGTVHDNIWSCHVAGSSPRCKRCDNIEAIKKEMVLKREELDNEVRRRETELELRRAEALAAMKLAEEKKAAFEKKKVDELAVRRLEIESRRLTREQKLREEHDGDDIEEAVRGLERDADAEVARTEKALRNQMRNRAKQAQEAIDRIEQQREEDLLKHRRDVVEQEQITQRVLRESQERLEQEQARTADKRAEVRRAQNARQREAEAAVQAEEDTLKLELRRYQAETAQKEKELEQEKDQAVKAAKDRRAREERMATDAHQQLDQQIAGVPALQDQLVEKLYTCVICLDDEVRRIDGFLCDNNVERHFCCDGCFGHHVQAKMDMDLASLKASEGKVFCPHKAPDLGCETSTALSEEDMFRHAPDAFQAYLAGQRKLLESQLAADIRKEERERLEAEQRRLARLSEVEREVHRHRDHVVGELLTLKCPRANCGQAFVDFNGCFALTCGRCACGFCAWCLQDCGRDAHAHVAACDQGQGTFATKATFDGAQRDRRMRIVRAYLHGIEDGGIRATVVLQCRQDFADLGLQALTDEFGRPAHAPAGDAGAVGEQELDLDALLAMQLHLEDGGEMFDEL